MVDPSQPILPPAPTVLRFAPSPNGYLHRGHAYSALFAEAMARRLGGRLILRIENIDVTRCKPELVDAMLEDLEWLGIQFDGEPVRQSDRFDLYGLTADRLRAEGLIYPCFCSRADIAANATGKTDPDGAPVYPGTCRHLDPHIAEQRIAGGANVAWRLDMDAALERTGPLTWAEMDAETLGIRHVAADPMAWGDCVLVRKDTPTSYHLAVVVDDAEQQITHVTRGMDLYFATAIHRVLQTLLGLPAPIYCHHKLIADDNDKKLSKSRGSVSLRDLRDKGLSAAQLRRELGFEVLSG